MSDFPRRLQCRAASETEGGRYAPLRILHELAKSLSQSQRTKLTIIVLVRYWHALRDSAEAPHINESPSVGYSSRIASR
jgi:hypothetical protein